MLWILLCCLPFPYIANTAGWLTAETGRQPWLVYGLMRTQEGYSKNVNAANSLFTLLGFMGLYALLAILLLFPNAPRCGARAGKKRRAHEVTSGAPVTTV